MFSPDVIALFGQLLGQVTLNANADDFEEVAITVIKAKRELAEAQAVRVSPSRVVATPDSTSPATAELDEAVAERSVTDEEALMLVEAG